LYSLDFLTNNKDLWKDLDLVPVICSYCEKSFNVKNGTLYNIIRRSADGIYCGRGCSGASRAKSTQNKYNIDGGKNCKRCNEFKPLDNFSSLPNPPYYRSECKRCHNFKPARFYNVYKEKSVKNSQEFKISMDYFLKYQDMECFYCGSSIKGIRIETKIFSVGFTDDNIISCCRSCQKFKSGNDHDNFLKMCELISNYTRGKK